MLFDYETLKLIWWLLIGVLLIGFAITDGMDMGVGMLLPFVARTDTERRVVINTVGAHWDGNQVWFITAGGALFAAWPMVYAAAFSGFYFAMMLVLFSLFLRPLAFDYRSKLDNPRWRSNWDWGLFVGSSVPALVFGVAFGNLLQGVPFTIGEFMRPSYQGGFLGLLNPLGLIAGVVSIAMLVMHGAIWLQMRAEQQIAERSARYLQWAVIAGLACFALAGWMVTDLGYRIVSMPDTNSFANPLGKQVVAEAGAWMANFNAQPLLWLAPGTAVAGMLMTLLLSKLNRPGFGFVFSSLALAGVIMTAGGAMFPFVMPSSLNPNASLTLWDAVSSHTTLNLMLIVAAIFIPLILCYTFWCYRRMWRRVTSEEVTTFSHTSY